MMVSHSTIFVTGFTAVRLKRTEPSGPVCEVPVYSSIWIRRSCASGPVVRRSVSRSRAVFGLVSRSSCAAWESPCRGV